MTSESPTKFDQLKFLMDHSHREAALFWQRNQAFLTAALTSFAACFVYFYERDPSFLVRLVAVCLGECLCLSWALVTHSSQQMNFAWLDNARKLAAESGDISEHVKWAVAEAPASELNRFPRATPAVFLLIGVLALAWLALLWI